MAEAVVTKYALATSNDCKESEAIVVVVNECGGELERGEARFRDVNRKRVCFKRVTSHILNATKPLRNLSLQPIQGEERHAFQTGYLVDFKPVFLEKILVLKYQGATML